MITPDNVLEPLKKFCTKVVNNNSEISMILFWIISVYNKLKLIFS